MTEKEYYYDLVKYDLDGGFKAKIKSLAKNGYYSNEGLEIALECCLDDFHTHLNRYCQEVIKEVMDELNGEKK